jgi:streptogramin lyase
MNRSAAEITGEVLATVPTPAGSGHSGLAWAEGTLWVAHYEERKIYQIDPQTGTVLRSIETTRFVTGVTWVDGELWHGTWEATCAQRATSFIAALARAAPLQAR